MAINKIICVCVCDFCGKQIDKKGFIHFPYYGSVGKIFCDKECLIKWVLDSLEEIHKDEPDINLD